MVVVVVVVVVVWGPAVFICGYLQRDYPGHLGNSGGSSKD